MALYKEKGATKKVAFDGFTLCGITTECKNLLVGGRIAKIAQPEKQQTVLMFLLDLIVLFFHGS